jgi:hypothetical protein
MKCVSQFAFCVAKQDSQSVEVLSAPTVIAKLCHELSHADLWKVLNSRFGHLPAVDLDFVDIPLSFEVRMNKTAVRIDEYGTQDSRKYPTKLNAEDTTISQKKPSMNKMMW